MTERPEPELTAEQERRAWRVVEEALRPRSEIAEGEPATEEEETR